MNESLEQLYQEAKSALKAKNYEDASELLKQILVVDENYKDASRLLARIVREKRRRWYNHPALWGTLGVLVLMGLGFLIASRIPKPAAIRPFASTITATFTLSPAVTSTPIQTQSPASTSIPLAWKRINMAQFIIREQITAIAVDPKDQDVVYAGTEGAGVYKSIDGGLSWRPIMLGLPTSRVNSLTIDPNNPQTIYIGLDAGEIYKSTNGGEKWDVYYSGINSTETLVIIDKNDSSHIFLGTQQQIMETKDGGKTWDLIYFDEDGCLVRPAAIVFDPENNQDFWVTNFDHPAGCSSSLFHFVESKNEVMPVPLPIQPIDNTGPYNIIAGINTQNKPYIVVSGREEAGDFYIISNDDGGTWRKLDHGFCGLTSLSKGGIIENCHGRISLSKDGGGTWQLISSNAGWEQLDVENAFSAASSDPNVLYGGAAGVFVSTDGGATWSEHLSGLPAQRMELRLDPADSSVFYLFGKRLWGNSDNPLYRSKDFGHDWDLLMNQGFGLEFDAAGIALYRGGNSSLYRSLDNGSTWTSLPLHGAKNFEGIAVDPSIPHKIFAVTGWPDEPKIIMSTDGGTTWVPVSIKYYGQLFQDPVIHFSHSDPAIAYLSQTYGTPLRSEDGGKTWVTCSNLDGIFSNGSDTTLAIHPKDSKRIMLATLGNNIFTSKDGCVSWDQSYRGLTNQYISSIAFDSNNPDTVYAGTDGGAYVSFDGGQSWGQINDGLLGATVVYSIVVDKDSNVYAATPYGIFKLVTGQ
jgi:photosystem II stability/assembly factor-like uncharacterized protein